MIRLLIRENYKIWAIKLILPIKLTLMRALVCLLSRIIGLNLREVGDNTETFLPVSFRSAHNL
jgi:hypothetical protein